MKNFASLLILFTLLLFACDANQVYEDYYTSASDGWHKDSTADFTFEISDTTSLYNLYVNTRNLENYGYSNLWLFTSITAPDGSVLADTVEFQLALPNGKWTGKGTSGVYHNQYTYRQAVYFPMSGTYTFSIRQGMRETRLDGLRNVGISVEKE